MIRGLRKGHTRALIDPQRMFNYNAAAFIEYGALQTKVPWTAAMESIEDYMDEYWSTANTENQLRTKTWPEIAKWSRLSLTREWWNVPAMSLYSSEPGREKSWRADALPWSETNTEAFAGLHNKGKRIVLVFDESAAIADLVWEVAEGALTDEHTEILWVAFGNPTQNTGRFRECFRRFRGLWNTRQIDSRTVEGTNKTYLDEFVATHGEDSDIVKVRVVEVDLARKRIALTMKLDAPAPAKRRAVLEDAQGLGPYGIDRRAHRRDGPADYRR